MVTVDARYPDDLTRIRRDWLHRAVGQATNRLRAPRAVGRLRPPARPPRGHASHQVAPTGYTQQYGRVPRSGTKRSVRLSCTKPGPRGNNLNRDSVNATPNAWGLMKSGHLRPRQRSAASFSMRQAAAPRRRRRHPRDVRAPPSCRRPRALRDSLRHTAPAPPARCDCVHPSSSHHGARLHGLEDTPRSIRGSPRHGTGRPSSIFPTRCVSSVRWTYPIPPPKRLRARAGRVIGPRRNVLARGLDYIADFIFNDWSARDLQFDEMECRLGPCQSKDSPPVLVHGW